MELEGGMNGTAALRPSVGAGAGAISSGAIEPAPIATLVVYKDDAGFGMKVSGDNPVYVQSVKEGPNKSFTFALTFVQLILSRL